ncbi:MULTISPECIES: hypothetical protein [unclassified Pseudonocardia]|uniref:hypothetical protein n=1 Tax=unclassified Pseudonocardia TaxID=2619320 RepID=UPI0001FFDDC2|nr:hypothetical protein [Pseudonocardia sp. Ae707_Ps1]
MTQIVAAFAGVLSATAALLAVVIARMTFRGQLMELARQAHIDLTTGEVAQARNVLGGVSFQESERIRAGDIEATRQAWFTVLWCFQRLAAARHRIASAGRVGRAPLMYFDELVGDQLRFMNEDYDVVRPRILRAVPALSDCDSKKSFPALFNGVHQGRYELGLWAQSSREHA